MIPTCAIPLPLGYDVWGMEWMYKGPDHKEIRVLWTSPNGRPIYVTAVADYEMLRTDEFWVTMLSRVQEYVRGTRTNKDLTGEKNERPIPTIEDPEYSRGPTTTTPARLDGEGGEQRDVAKADQMVR